MNRIEALIAEEPGPRSELEADPELLWIEGQIAALVPPSEARDRALRGPWLPTPVPGVAAKVLELDPERDRRAVLLKMDPGRQFPAHRHHGEEECLLLRGDLAAADTHLEVGKPVRMAAGSEHGNQSTEGGCLVLVVGSIRDAS